MSEQNDTPTKDLTNSVAGKLKSYFESVKPLEMAPGMVSAAVAFIKATAPSKTEAPLAPTGPDAAALAKMDELKAVMKFKPRAVN